MADRAISLYPRQADAMLAFALVKAGGSSTITSYCALSFTRSRRKSNPLAQTARITAPFSSALRRTSSTAPSLMSTAVTSRAPPAAAFSAKPPA